MAGGGQVADVCVSSVAQIVPYIRSPPRQGCVLKRPIVDNTRSALKLRRCAAGRSLWRLPASMLCSATRLCMLGISSRNAITLKLSNDTVMMHLSLLKQSILQVKAHCVLRRR